MIEGIENRDILNFEIEKSAVNEKKIIGTFNKNSTTIELLNPDNKYSNLKGTYIDTIKGTFFIENIEPIQENIKIRLKCYDLANKFDSKYDSSNFTFPMSLKQWKIAICEEVGVSCDTDDFPNCDYILEEEPYLDNNATYRDAIKMIVQAASSWAIIDYDDVLKFQWFDDTVNNDIEDWFELTTDDEETKPVNIVILGRGDVEDNVIYPEVEPSNPKEIRIDSNEILDLNRRTMIRPIFNQVNGFKYTKFSMKTPGRLNAKVGESIEYKDMYLNTHRSYIMSHILVYCGGNYTIESNWTSKFEAVELDETNTNYKFAESIEEKTNRTERMANKLNGIISDVVEQVSSHDDRISSVEQTAEHISQSVQEIYDAKRNATGKVLILENCSEGQLYSLKIIGDIIPVFPRRNLYPSSDLFLKPKPKIKVTHEENEEGIIVNYDLPFTYLAKYSNEVYDEFIVDSENNAKLIRRVGLDADGNKYPLELEEIINLGELPILLFEGTNKIEVDYYSVDLECEYVVKNDITDFYAVNIQVNSLIKQTREEINLEVRKKVDSDEVVSTINQSAEQITITGNRFVVNSKNFNLEADGTLTCKNANLTGQFSNYDSEGNLAVRISGTKIKLYDYEGTGKISGVLSSTRDTKTSKIVGVNLYTIQGNEITLGYKENESDTTISSIIQFDTNSLDSTPFIVNTADGTIFPNNPSGGIVVENGLIKNWSLRSPSGTITVYEPNDRKTVITVANGLITNWEYS